jgi:hypothetical protein
MIKYNKKGTSKNKKNGTNYRNEFWDRKCLEIQTYLGSKKSSESWKFIKNIRLSNCGKSQINLISADVWKKILLQTFSRES